MGPKAKVVKSDHKSIATTDEVIITPRTVSLRLCLIGESPGDFNFLALFDGQIVLDGRWSDGLELETEHLALNLKDPDDNDLVAEQPLVLILRLLGGKGSKETDPLQHLDNKIAATVDLFPLVLGESDIFVEVNLVYIETGENSGCSVVVAAHAGAGFDSRLPLVLTMVSAHCLPTAKEGTVYVSAIGINKDQRTGQEETEEINESTGVVPVNFRMSLSSVSSQKVLWAEASAIGMAASTGISVSDEDYFVHPDLEPADTGKCNSAYWHAMKRVLVNPEVLQQQLQSPLLLEVAGVPRLGKVDVRGRYMAFLDARVLLVPGILGATISAPLLFFNELNLPENLRPVLDLPPSSAKVSARDTDRIMDEYGHPAYIKIRFDLSEPLVPKTKIQTLYEIIGSVQVLAESQSVTVDELHVEPPPDDPCIDVRRIRKECGALAVHKELSTLACRGSVPMNQSIKRTAANRLLVRVRSMLKQFPPGDCSYLEWQDTVTAQHAASRRAVTASFAPQPPAPHPPPRMAAARSRVTGDNRIAEIHAETNYKRAPHHPATLLSKALRCLEQRNDSIARNHLVEALIAQKRNRFVLWAYGAQDFDKGEEFFDKAAAAFRIAVTGNHSDGVANAIGWAALHAVNHFGERYDAAFYAALRMRKSYKLPRDWHGFLKRWESTSGEEEIFWIPQVVATDNPLIIAAAFFLCLRGYKLCERLLQCVHDGCAFRGAQNIAKITNTPDVPYIRAVSFLLRRLIDKALKITDEGIRGFGPIHKLLQMRTTCLLCSEGWNGDCDDAIRTSEKAGAVLNPVLLIQAALGGMSSNPHAALQRAARAHRIAPCAQSALTIARIYEKMDECGLSERWAAAAVKLEPLLADGWAFLALLAMYDRNVDKAKTLIRTAKQAGPLSPDIKDDLKEMMAIVHAEGLPDALVKNLCLCEYY